MFKLQCTNMHTHTKTPITSTLTHPQTCHHKVFTRQGIRATIHVFVLKYMSNTAHTDWRGAVDTAPSRSYLLIVPSASLKLVQFWKACKYSMTRARDYPCNHSDQKTVTHTSSSQKSLVISLGGWRRSVSCRLYKVHSHVKIEV